LNSTRHPEHSVGVCQRGVEVAPVEHAGPDGVRSGILVQHDLVFQGLLAVENVRERVVVDLDELGGVACELACTRNHRRHWIADVAHAADRERIVLDVRPRRRRELEEGVREDRDLVARQGPVDAVQLESLRDVDRLDPRVGVRRAHEVDIAHLVALDVVEEHALPLDETLVLLARHVLPDETRFDVPFFDDERALGSDCRLRHSRTGETMFPPCPPFFLWAYGQAPCGAPAGQSPAPPASGCSRTDVRIIATPL
jgi:hypothetical protein